MPNGDVHSVVHNNQNKLSVLKLLKMGRDVAYGMNWLHLSKPPIIHRDLKPNNLLVDANWNVKVCDFGLSAFQRTETLQDTGVAPGTPLWMAPEVLMGKPLSEKADVYAFGIVFWEMLTGQEPFAEHDSYNSFVSAICQKHERPPIPQDMHVSVAKILQDCWAHEPPQRPSFTEIIVRLEDAMLASSVPDTVAQALWKKNWAGQLSVSFSKFIPVFYAAINEPLARDREGDASYKVLRHLLIVDGTGFKEGDAEEVTLERFGRMMKWFGNLNNDHGHILKRLVSLAQQAWFHGEMERPACETLLANIKDHGVFLVRLSTTEPEKTPFTISKYSRDGTVTHQRINARSDGRGHYVAFKTKKGNEKIEAPGGVENLIAKCAKELRLKKACPGSRYHDFFEKRVTPTYNDGYLPAPDDSDDE
jgi:serine/threonine protein kinase